MSTKKWEELKLEKWYVEESEEYPVKGVSSESKEDAKETLRKRERQVEEQLKKAQDADKLFWVEYEPHNSSTSYDTLRVRAGLNLAGTDSITTYKHFPRTSFVQCSLEDGFMVWGDIVADNYFIRSLLRAFSDKNLNTGQCPDFSYRMDLFRTLMKLWDP